MYGHTYVRTYVCTYIGMISLYRMSETLYTHTVHTIICTHRHTEHKHCIHTLYVCTHTIYVYTPYTHNVYMDTLYTHARTHAL